MAAVDGVGTPEPPLFSFANSLRERAYPSSNCWIFFASPVNLNSASAAYTQTRIEWESSDRSIYGLTAL